MDKKEAIKNGLIGGGMGFLMSTLMNYFIVPFPDTVFSNAIGNGISGLISGFFGGFFAIIGYSKQLVKRESASGEKVEGV